MTIDEAIERLKRHQEGDSRCCHPERYDAIKLGIEALKREQENRQGTFSIPLPSETTS